MAAGECLDDTSVKRANEQRTAKAEKRNTSTPPFSPVRDNLNRFDKDYHHKGVRGETYNWFRQLCQQHSLAVTHQRQRIYEALVSHPGHYSPEEIYEQVKQDLPSISLATV